MLSRKPSIHSVLGSLVAGTILLGAVAWLTPQAAHAQSFTFQTSSRIGEGDGRIGESDIRSLVKALKLDADQEALVRALYEGHRSAWDEATAEHRQATKALFEGGQDSGKQRDIARKMQGMRKQWQATRDQLESEFLGSVKDIVSSDQLANWPRFERDRRRHSRQAMQSSLGGEGVDLIEVSESINLADEAMSRLEPVSAMYAEELDLAIADRTRATEALEEQTTPPEGGDFTAIDGDAMQQAQAKLHEKHLAVRDVNERYAALFSGQLRDEDAQNFMSLYLERSFPSVYRPTAADRYLKVVGALDSLNEEQVRALDSIDSEYERQVGIINDQIVLLIRQEEDKAEQPGFLIGTGPEDGHFDTFAVASKPSGDGAAGEFSIGMVIATTASASSDPGPPAGGEMRRLHAAPPVITVPGRGAEDDSPRGKLKKSKGDLVDRTIEAVAALLSPEQLALAPKPDALQRLAPEEQMRRMVERALENAVFEVSGDGEPGVTITVGGGK